jgi:hypothetical protein
VYDSVRDQGLGFLSGRQESRKKKVPTARPNNSPGFEDHPVHVPVRTDWLAIPMSARQKLTITQKRM